MIVHVMNVPCLTAIWLHALCLSAYLGMANAHA